MMSVVCASVRDLSESDYPILYNAQDAAVNIN